MHIHKVRWDGVEMNDRVPYSQDSGQIHGPAH